MDIKQQLADTQQKLLQTEKNYATLQAKYSEDTDALNQQVLHGIIIPPSSPGSHNNWSFQCQLYPRRRLECALSCQFQEVTITTMEEAKTGRKMFATRNSNTRWFCVILPPYPSRGVGNYKRRTDNVACSISPNCSVPLFYRNSRLFKVLG